MRSPRKVPDKNLRESLKHSGGRNNTGRITADHRGGGHKRLYRLIDFKRDKTKIPAKVEAIEYDPNRSARIALLRYADGERRYILAPERLQVGDSVIAGDDDVDIQPGNSLPLKFIPVGTVVHNVELKIGKGGQLVRSAGLRRSADGQGRFLCFIEDAFRRAPLCLSPSVEPPSGQVGNADQENISWGKAGRIRWLGWRPGSRGIAKNPVDHPHGGGEGRSKGNHPMTPWGKPTKGYKTRKNHSSDKYIVKGRKAK